MAKKVKKKHVMKRSLNRTLGTSTPTVSFILLEDSSGYILTENGDKIILE